MKQKSLTAGKQNFLQRRVRNFVSEKDDDIISSSAGRCHKPVHEAPRALKLEPLVPTVHTHLTSTGGMKSKLNEQAKLYTVASAAPSIRTEARHSVHDVKSVSNTTFSYIGKSDNRAIKQQRKQIDPDTLSQQPQGNVGPFLQQVLKN